MTSVPRLCPVRWMKALPYPARSMTSRQTRSTSKPRTPAPWRPAATPGPPPRRARPAPPQNVSTDQGPGVRPGSWLTGGGRGGHRAGRAAGDDGMVQGRGARDRRPAGRRRSTSTRATRTTVSIRPTPGRSARVRSTARPLGEASDPRRGLRRYHLGRLYRFDRAGPIRQSVRGRAGRARRGGGPGVAARSPRGRGSAASRWTASAATSSSEPDTAAPLHPSNRTQPGGTEVHGNGVHMDDYETRDDRRLIPGTGLRSNRGIYYG